MEMAAKTWGSGEWWKKSQGCGSAWEAITYDPKMNRVYFGVDGPAPWNPAARSSDAGDELASRRDTRLPAGSLHANFRVRIASNSQQANKKAGPDLLQ